MYFQVILVRNLVKIPREMIFVNFVSTFGSNCVQTGVVENFRYFLDHTSSADEFESALSDAEHLQTSVASI